MADGIYLAMAGAAAQYEALDVVSNNLANSSTTAYRAERTSFAEALARTAARTPDLAFVTLAGTRTDPTPGTIVETGNPLDVAIHGAGYFAVQTPAGVRYTRAGDFQLDPAGNLVTVDGHRVLGTNGRPLAAPVWAQDVMIDHEGNLHSPARLLTFGTLKIVQLDPASITRAGARLVDGRPMDVPQYPPELVPASLEQSNFSALRGMVDLVRITRTAEAQHRMIEAYREINQRAARDLGRGR